MDVFWPQKGFFDAVCSLFVTVSKAFEGVSQAFRERWVASEMGWQVDLSAFAVMKTGRFTLLQ
jgi:hypothetical protein